MIEKKRYYRTYVNLEDNNHEPYYNIRDKKKEGNNVLFMIGGKYTSKKIVDLLNEQEEEIQRLKIQLQTDDVCNKCKHEYLVQQNDGYYISKCKKGFDECSKGNIKYCEDFELKGDD